MKLSTIFTIIIATSAISTTFYFGANIEGQLFNIAIAEMQSVYDTPLILPKKIPRVIYLPYQELLNTFKSITPIIPNGIIRGFCNIKTPDRIYVDKNLDIFLLHSTILHEFVHILQLLNPRGPCRIIEKCEDILKCDKEVLINCVFYREMQAYTIENNYRTSFEYDLLM